MPDDTDLIAELERCHETMGRPDWEVSTGSTPIADTGDYMGFCCIEDGAGRTVADLSGHYDDADDEDAANAKAIATLRNALPAIIAALRQAATDRETLAAYKTATGIVQDVAHIDELNDALHREAERGVELARQRDELTKALREAGRSKIVVAGDTPDQDKRELCWCHCNSDRCLSEPRCRAATESLANVV